MARRGRIVGLSTTYDMRAVREFAHKRGELNGKFNVDFTI